MEGPVQSQIPGGDKFQWRLGPQPLRPLPAGQSDSPLALLLFCGGLVLFQGCKEQNLGLEGGGLLLGVFSHFL